MKQNVVLVGLEALELVKMVLKEKKPSIVFMGTPEFAAFSLEKLHSVYPVSAVVTIEDKAIGRGLKISESAIKKKAMELNIPIILQPNSLKDDSFAEQIKQLKPDIIVVIAFKILPKKVYSLSFLGSFNIHGSLLPKYRGAAPIQWAIVRGEKETGVTSFLLTDTVDTGNILGKKVVKIDDRWNAEDLHDALMPLAAELTIETCTNLITNSFSVELQDDSQASSAPKLFRENSKINWNSDTVSVRNFIRGMTPFPSAWTLFESVVMKVMEVQEYSGTEIVIEKEFCITDTHFLVGCLGGVVSIEKLQMPNKSVMKTIDFLRGYRGMRNGSFQ